MAFCESYEEICGIAKEIYDNPELGYKEYKTSARVKEFLKKYAPDLEIQEFSKTGVKINLPRVNEGEDTINMVFIAELDAVYTPNHFHSDKETGAAHNCGHYTQVAIALSLFKEFILTKDYEKLDFNISFVFVPAEEFVDLEYRAELKEKGEIQYFGGKPQAMSEGIFDEFDFGITIHSMGGKFDKRTIEINCDLAGFFYKNYRFKGKAAHAGFAPNQGVNAYSMSTVFNVALGLLRQHFSEEQMVRVNPVILEHAMGVNVIPEMVKVGCDFRSQSLEYILEGGKKLDNAARGAALSLSGEVEIETVVGYMPFKQDRYINSFFEREYEKNEKIEAIIKNQAVSAAGDVGDLSYMFPCVQVGYSGFRGTIHGVDFIHEDMEYIFSIFPEYLYEAIKSMANNIDKTKLYKRTYEDYKKIIDELENS